ncbi:epsilon-sarcoglycan isoform X2 [Vespa crabro]|uniref:epsilon-sarcoglycan isoform X2 n=1 Tax=Vespa crabro TaxID=7445 RepID=UPI001F00E51E|nr:epsilon-sarcoglycan isoform X2 [Vespa crabro]
MHRHVEILIILTTFACAENILMTEVFVIPIRPETFDWSPDGKYDQFTYQPSLLNAPDLPSWIHYVHSKRDHGGFLYGVAPKNQKYFQLEIVGLNKYTYETKYKVLDINVLEKQNLTRYEVNLKIDNLNVEDTFGRNRTEKLLDIFRNKLWTTATDLYVTFLASAVELGARLPLKPGESEGVVMRLGSSIPFSQELIELQEEVKPLWKLLPSCPRDFKRTSVERLFREAGFLLDWCSFRLIESDEQNLQRESARRGPSMNIVGLPSSGISEHTEWQWARSTKADIPTRSYFKEIVTTIFVPTILLLLLATSLSTALCLHRDKIKKTEPSSVETMSKNGVQMVQYVAPERGTLRSLSVPPSSPNDSLTHTPRISSDRCNPYIRPNPPPYTGPSNLYENRFLTIRGARKNVVLLNKYNKNALWTEKLQ